ncbi:MAG: hypothetical protein R2793_08520 [Flavobacteriaceae bacterium]
MKKTISLHFLLLLVLTLLFASCQKEEQQIIDDTNNAETIAANSTLTGLLRSASQNDGSTDDIIDSSSCIHVVYPVQVVANGQELTITSESDLQLIEDIFNQFPGDIDTLQIVFPITVSLEDFTQITVNSQTELDSLIANCQNAITDDFNCVDFVYPITVFTYNSNNEQTGTQTISNDAAWFAFLIGLDESSYFAIDYPITVIVNGTSVTVNSNTELLNAIQQADCNSGGNTTTSNFEDVIVTGVWYVTYFFDDLDETADFASYEFTFATDGTAQASNNAGNTPGTWNYYLDSGVEKVDLFFGTASPLDEIDEDWEILEATENIIRLKHISGDGSVDFLTYERTPYNGGGGNVNPFIENLVDGTWFVNFMEDSGTDETCDYVEYEFTFNLNGSVTAVSPSTTKNGFWTVTDSSSGLDLVLNFDISGSNDPFEDLNDDWDVTSYDAQGIQLIDISGGNGGTDYLNFGRNPYTGCGGGGGGQDLVDILLAGPWFVSNYDEDGNNQTSNYTGYTLTFATGGSVTATNGTNTFNGTWVVTGSTTLDLTLDFGTQAPFDEFNEDWDVLSYSSTTVTLQHISGGNGGTDNLVLERL